MRRYYIVSGIIFILSIVDFAVTAPVLVQEKRQAGIDVVPIPEDAVTVLGKRGGDLDKLLVIYEDHFATSEESSAARPSSSSPQSGSDHGQMDVKQPLPSHPEGWSPVSSPEHAPPSPGPLTESEYELMEGDVPPVLSSPASSTMSDADHELVGTHASPNSGPSTESDHESTAVHAPLSSPVLPTWFQTDHGFMGPHAPQPNSDHTLVAEEPPSSGPASPIVSDADHGYQVVYPPPPAPASLTEFDADNEYQVVHPPPSRGSASPTESDHEMVDVPPSSSVSSANPDRRSMGAGSRLENLQAVSDALKLKAMRRNRIVFPAPPRCSECGLEGVAT